MHALRVNCRLVATTALLFSSFVSAGPVFPRQEGKSFLQLQVVLIDG